MSLISTDRMVSRHVPLGSITSSVLFNTCISSFDDNRKKKKSRKLEDSDSCSYVKDLRLTTATFISADGMVRGANEIRPDCSQPCGVIHKNPPWVGPVGALRSALSILSQSRTERLGEWG